MTNKIPQWEKEFDKEFTIDEWSEIFVAYAGIHPNKIKAFIKSTLEAERTRIIKAIEGLKIITTPDEYESTVTNIEKAGFNRAIEEAIKVMEKE